MVDKMVKATASKAKILKRYARPSIRKRLEKVHRGLGVTRSVEKTNAMEASEKNPSNLLLTRNKIIV